MAPTRILPVAIVCTLLAVSLALPAWSAGPAATSAPAAATPTPASRPAAEPILKVIPAGTLGYAVLHNVQASAADVDKFLKTIGATELIKDEVPAGVLKAALSGLALGEGFNPNGGLAVAMLDPNAFGIDVAKLVKSAIPGATTAPADAAAAPTQLPFVIFLPGSNVKEVLGAFNPQVAEPYMKVNLDGLEVFAAPLGSYVLLSPNPKALDAVAHATKKADDELKGRHAKIIRDSAIAVRLNVKAAWPLLQKALKALDLLAAAKDEGLVDSLPLPVTVYKELKPVMGGYLDQLSQMEELSLGLRIAAGGVVLDGSVTYRAGSNYAKALAFPGPQTPMMDLLAGESYIMAVSSTLTLTQKPAAKEIAAKNIEAALENPALAKVPRAQRDKVLKLAGEFLDELDDIGFVMGGTPEGAKGMMGMALVLRGQDSAKIKALLERTAALTQEVLQELAKAPKKEGQDEPEDETLKGVKVAYEKGQEKMEGTAVDSIVVTLPGVDNGPLSMILSMAFGERQVAPLVAAADKNTVVISFGGGREGLARALKAAAGKQDKDMKILVQKETAEAMKFMPKDPHTLLFFNVANYFDAMVAGMKKSGMGEGFPFPFAFTCKTPIAFGMGAQGTGQNFSLYVPTDIVKEIIDMVTAMQGMFGGHGGGGPAPGPAPVPGGDDF